MTYGMCISGGVLGADVGIFLGMDVWSISPLYITLWFDTCIEHLNTRSLHF